MKQIKIMSPESRRIEPRSGDLRDSIGKTALFDMELEKSAMHFYRADDSMISISAQGAEVIVSWPWKGESVGVGESVDVAFDDAIGRMRALETVKTSFLAELEIAYSARVSFSHLDHFRPKAAPGNEVYTVPWYLEDLIRGYPCLPGTYKLTTDEKDWQLGLRGLLEEYIETDPNGQSLAAGLKVRSLSHVSPEQATKLSAAFVCDVSKYNYQELRGRYFSRADMATSYELLRAGMEWKNDPTYEGNGVCRHIATNIKTVFEAIKGTQVGLSMLNNTYCAYNVNQNGIGYVDARDGNNGMQGAHAWNTFITIDEKGSAVATIIDATWALDKDDAIIKRLDQTEARAAAQMIQLYNKSTDKEVAFEGLTEGVDTLLELSYTNPRQSVRKRKLSREYIVTEYLKAAIDLERIPEGVGLPRSVARVAFTQLRHDLTGDELDMLFTLDNAGGAQYRHLLRQL